MLSTLCSSARRFPCVPFPGAWGRSCRSAPSAPLVLAWRGGRGFVFSPKTPPWPGAVVSFRPIWPRPGLAWCLGGAIRCGSYAASPGFLCTVVSLVLLGVYVSLGGLDMAQTPNFLFFSRSNLSNRGNFSETNTKPPRNNRLRGRTDTAAPIQVNPEQNPTNQLGTGG